ncbi:MAG: hypothetical protein BWY71_02266 [Planctomycetes bacterium ADurb.Bin412]|nr:MAG: hypothetical protein BWY71_02266 [Planctomycetes bacterium ADurb.Bin412]
MLDEVKLLIGGGNGEIVPRGGLPGALGAEGRIGQDQIIAIMPVRLIDGIAQMDGRFEAVQKEVHQGQPPRPGDQVLSVIGFLLDAFDLIDGDCPLGLFHQPFIGRHQKAARPAGRVANLHFIICQRVGLHQPDHRLDEYAGGKILARAFFPFTGRLFQQPLEGVGLDIDPQAGPVFRIDHGDDLLEADRIVELGHRLGEDIPQQPLGLPQCLQDRQIMIGQGCAG